MRNFDIKQINTDTTEGKILMAALTIITTSEEHEDKTPQEVLSNVLFERTSLMYPEILFKNDKSWN